MSEYDKLMRTARYSPTTVGNMVLDKSGAYCSIEAIEQLEHQLEEARMNYLGAMTDCGNLERQLAERDAEIAKYRDAPVVAWKISFKSQDTPDGFLSVHYHGTNAIADYRQIDPNAVCEHLIVKPGE